MKKVRISWLSRVHLKSVKILSSLKKKKKRKKKQWFLYRTVLQNALELQHLAGAREPRPERAILDWKESGKRGTEKKQRGRRENGRLTGSSWQRGLFVANLSECTPPSA